MGLDEQHEIGIVIPLQFQNAGMVFVEPRLPQAGGRHAQHLHRQSARLQIVQAHLVTQGAQLVSDGLGIAMIMQGDHENFHGDGFRRSAI